MRDPQKPGAKALAGAGAKLARGDLDDEASIGRALEGAYGVFSVQNFFQAGYEGKIQQGRMLADLAEVAGVSHFVYSSVGSAYRHTGIHHFESKRHIEEHCVPRSCPTRSCGQSFSCTTGLGCESRSSPHILLPA